MKKSNKNLKKSKESIKNSVYNSFKYGSLLIICIIILIMSIFYQSFSKNKKIETLPSQYRGLASFNSISSEDVLSNYDIISSDKKRYFKQDIIAYATPWNRAGYENIINYNNKFNIIAPVWFNIQPIPNSNLQNYHKDSITNYILITGDNDIDSRILTLNSTIIPRFLFNGLNPNDIIRIFSSQELLKSFSLYLFNFIDTYGFNGATIEIFNSLYPLYSSDNREFHDIVIKGISKLSKFFKKNNLKTILVVPPISIIFGKKEFNFLKNSVYKFSLNLYDYNSYSNKKIVPNAPVEWIKNTINNIVDDGDNDKLCVGLNFYGYKYTSNSNTPIINNDFINILKNHPKSKLIWEEDTAEHRLTYSEHNKKIVVYFPSLSSIFYRIKLLEEYGCCISIWEIGQGLPYFIDLL